MGWSSQAAVVSGGRLQLPVPGVAQSNIPNLAASYNGSQAAELLSGPALATVGRRSWMQLLQWSNSPSGADNGTNGAHFEIRYVSDTGVPVVVGIFDISGLLLPPLGAPGTPASGCYLFYQSGSPGTLFAKGPSGTAVAIAST